MRGDPQDKVAGTVGMRGDPFLIQLLGLSALEVTPSNTVAGTVSTKGDPFKQISWDCQHENGL